MCPHRSTTPSTPRLDILEVLPHESLEACRGLVLTARPETRPRASVDAAPLDIAGSLRGERIFITGATGFLGKVLVEKLLWSVPDVGKLLLLVRPGADRDAEQRLRDEVLASPIMARLRALHGDDWQAWATSKVEAVSGDLGRDRFGLDDESYAALCRDVDRVVASAATVTFDERLDRALELNARGALRTLALARDAGDAPLLHVSTCYVSGRRQGRIAERLGTLGAANDPTTTLAALDDACRRLGDKAGDAPGDAAFVAAGVEQARRHGFNDVYTLTKALAERLLAREKGSVPLAIVRPAIVTSAAEQPIAGWIDAVRVIDPLLVAYGRGRVRELPGAADVPLELVPVDHVVHALLAALADLRPGETEPRVYQVGSRRNPITLGELMSWAREGFASTPLRDSEDRPIELEAARFIEPEQFRRDLIAKRERGDARERRALDHFIRLSDVFGPYLSGGASYEDDATRALWDRLPAADRETFDFDVEALDWRSYVSGVHVPGVMRFALKAETGAPPPTRSDEPSTDLQRRAERFAAEAGTLFELFAAIAGAEHDTMAFQTFRNGRWLRYTYGQALIATANVAARLQGQYGIERGDRVVLWASGRPEWVLTTLALHRLGAVSVPLDPQWPAEEIEEAARLVEARLICGAPRLVESLGESPLVETQCPVVELAAPFVPEPDVGLLPGAESVGATGDCSDLASIIFTSGTTVAPKAVPLTHGNYLANVRDLVPLMRLTRERLLSVLPIHHVFEQMVGLLVPLAGGSTISYVAEIKPQEISWMMSTTRPTVLVAVPRLLGLLHGGIFKSVEAGGPLLRGLFRVLFALSRLTGGRHGHRLFKKVHQRFGGCLRRIATGGSALDPELGRSFQLMGFSVAEGYGMTETSPVLTVNPWDAIRFGSAGKPLPGVEIDLRTPGDATGVEEDSGEIWVRGANVMAGYYGNPETTAEVLRDGWLNTCDIGFFDSGGYLHLSGRTKDVIVTDAGKNVYPEEVEARYRDLPGVEELVVLGLPTEGRGERVCALVVPRSGATEQDVEQIRDAIAERSAEIPSYQRVTGVEIWRGDLPKTTTLKVKRGLLRDAVIAGQRGDGDSKPAASAAQDEPPRGEEETWMVDTLARLTRTRPDLIQASDRLDDLGVDSLTRVELISEIETRFDLRLDDSAAAGLGRVGDLFELPAS
ncbi:MAG: AMP-binding protein [bacterium]|nr:AMP-binding protein [bacterium]